jgi:hypothetical protein
MTRTTMLLQGLFDGCRVVELSQKSGRKGEKSMFWRMLASPRTMFLLGAASGVVLKAIAPAVGSMVRPLVRETIKGGILLTRQVQAVVQEAWQEVEDLTAEAQAAVDQEHPQGPASHSHAS